MGEDTKIQWTDNTFNPWIGCTKVHDGCTNCYAETWSKRWENRKNMWGPYGKRMLTSTQNWSKPMKWQRACARRKVTQRVFCGSLCDFFEPWAHNMCNASGVEQEGMTMDTIRLRLLKIISASPNLQWQLLTKRPSRILEVMAMHEGPLTHSIWQWPNVWLGASVSDQQSYDHYYGLLHEQGRDLVPILFLSIEPLLSEIDLHLDDIPERQHPNWVIIGGESGANARPCYMQEIKSLVDQCKAQAVPVFVKQLGKRPINDAMVFQTKQPHTGKHAYRISDPKGGDPREWVPELRVQQFPLVPSFATV